MALQTDKVLLPKEVAAVITKKAKDTSTIAALSPSEPQLFLDKEYMVFSGNAEAEVIAEGEQKSSYEETLSPVVGKRGSSPRMRGKPSMGVSAMMIGRIIPAHAGQTKPPHVGGFCLELVVAYMSMSDAILMTSALITSMVVEPTVAPTRCLTRDQMVSERIASRNSLPSHVSGPTSAWAIAPPPIRVMDVSARLACPIRSIW